MNNSKRCAPRPEAMGCFRAFKRVCAMQSMMMPCRLLPTTSWQWRMMCGSAS